MLKISSARSGQSDSNVQQVSLSLHSYESVDGLQQIYGDWLGLMTRISERSIFQHPAWYLAYFKAIDNDEMGIKFFCIYRGDLLVAVLPIAFERKGLIMSALLPRTVGLFNSDFAISDREIKPEIWRYVGQKLNEQENTRWDVFLVRGEGILENSCVAQCVLSDSGRTIREEKADCCDVIEFGDYDESVASLKGNFRRDLNRRKRRLAQERAVEYVCVSDRSLIEEAFDVFVELEKSGWKGRSDASKIGYPTPSAIGLFDWKYLFYKHLMIELSKLGEAEICFIQADERPISAQLCVVLNRTSFMLKTAYDENAKRYAPGHLGVDYLLKRYASSEKVKRLNLLTDYGWHANWNPTKLRYLQVTQFNNTLVGLVLSLAYRVRMIMLKLVRFKK